MSAMLTATFLAVFAGPSAQASNCPTAGSRIACAVSDASVLVVDASVDVPHAVTAERPGVFDITVEHGRLVSRRRVLVVHRNDDVTLHITTDAPDEFHLHGYNRLVQLVPGKTATLHFRANLTGRFTYELHKTGLELGALEVYP